MDPNACFALYLVSDEFPEIKRECCDDLVKWIKGGGFEPAWTSEQRAEFFDYLKSTYHV